MNPRHRVPLLNRILEALDAKQVTSLIAIVASLGGFVVNRQQMDGEREHSGRRIAALTARCDSIGREAHDLKARVRRLEARAHVKASATEAAPSEPQPGAIQRLSRGLLKIVTPWTWGKAAPS